MNPRPYQVKLFNETRNQMASGHKRVIVVSPTGSGKSLIFAMITDGAAKKGKRVMLLLHRNELLRQAKRLFTSMNIRHGVIASGDPVNQLENVQIASVHTLVKRLGKIIPPDVIVGDELHHGVSPTYLKIFEAFKEAHVVGFTATPQRLDGKGLRQIVSSMVLGPNVADLIRDGYLTPVRYLCPPPQFDGSSFHVRAGDFKKEEIEEAMDRPTITGDAVAHYKKWTPGQPAIAFCVSVKHAEHVAAAFNSAGVKSSVIEGNMGSEERAKLIAGLGDGTIEVLVSVDLLGEGVDVPIVSVAILLRHTQSLALHLQQIGRILRPHPGKSVATVLDHVGNCSRLGYAEETREWSLDGCSPKSASDRQESFPVKQCPKCYRVHSPSPQCPECGHVYENKREIEQVAGELESVQPVTCGVCSKMYPHSLPSCPHCRVDKRRAEGAARTYEELAALGRARGYREGWAKFRWEARMRKVAA